MKNIDVKVAIAFLIGASILPGVARAADQASPSSEQRSAIVRQLDREMKVAALERYDLNHDGVLDANEKAGMKTDRERRRQDLASTLRSIEADSLRRFDANGNQYLDASERETMRRERTAEIKRITGRAFAKYDSNGNGILDPGEEAAYERDRAELQGRHERALARHDANRNGVLDPEEKEQMRVRRDLFLDRINSLNLRLFDANRNGILDPDEKAAIRERAAAVRRSGQPTETRPDQTPKR